MAFEVGSKLEAGIGVLEGLIGYIASSRKVCGNTRQPQITEAQLMKANQAIADIKVESRKLIVLEPVAVKKARAVRPMSKVV